MSAVDIPMRYIKARDVTKSYCKKSNGSIKSFMFSYGFFLPCFLLTVFLPNMISLIF